MQHRRRVRRQALNSRTWTNRTTPRPRGRGIYLLPNLFTTGGLFAGFYAIIAATQGSFENACVAMFIAAILDGVDGRVARLTNTQSEFGMQYDSLADLISFGLAPALVMYHWALSSTRLDGVDAGQDRLDRAPSCMPPAPRCGWRGSTRRSGRSTSAGSSAWPARRRRGWWPASSGPATTTATAGEQLRYRRAGRDSGRRAC